MVVHGRKLSVDGFHGSATVFLPCREFSYPRFPIRDPAVQALEMLRAALFWNAPGPALKLPLMNQHFYAVRIPATTKGLNSMDEMGIVFSVFGIAVSIAIFLFGYRSTIGARKERVRSGNDEVEKILVRRIVLEQFEPTSDEISRIIDAKARDFRIRSTDLLSEEQLLNNIYTRIVESDFIAREQREETLERLNRTLNDMHHCPSSEQSLEDVVTQTSTTGWTTIALATMAATATVAGMFFAILPNFPLGLESLAEVWPLLLSTAVTSLALIGLISATLKFRERQQEEPSKSEAFSSHVQFESEVLGLLRSHVVGQKSRIEQPRADKNYDFCIEHNGNRTLIQVKNWRRRVPHSLIAREIFKLEGMLKEEDASLAILVVPRKTVVSQALDNSEQIKVMTPRELRRHLKFQLCA